MTVLRDESMIVLCALTAIGAQLDRAQLARDMRAMAEVMTRECPELAGSVGAVNQMATLIENASAGLAGDLPAMLKAGGLFRVN